MTIEIMYHAPITPLCRIAQGDWIDLRAAEEIALRQGESRVISLGVSMKLPGGYEAHVLPRSSTFKRYGVIQVNGMGVIDESYCGADDVWFFQVYATRDAVIPFDDRICQFRIVKKMPDVELVTVESLQGENRGGHGSTGAK